MRAGFRPGRAHADLRAPRDARPELQDRDREPRRLPRHDRLRLHVLDHSARRHRAGRAPARGRDRRRARCTRAAVRGREITAERSDMADIAKVITIIGSSPESFAKAADAAVQEASKTVRGITGADVISMSALVENDRITQYRTTVNIAFGVER